MIDSAAVARVDRIVEDSASYGKVIVRGGPVTDGSLASGAFYRPTGSKSRTSAHRSSSKKSSGRSRHSRSTTKKGGHISAAVDSRPRGFPPDVAPTPPSRIAYPPRQDGRPGSGRVAPGVG
jgi:hypothetical protein